MPSAFDQKLDGGHGDGKLSSVMDSALDSIHSEAHRHPCSISSSAMSRVLQSSLAS